MSEDEPDLPTLYEWAGGLVPLRRMIDCFYDRVEADDALSGFFPGGVSERHRAHVADAVHDIGELAIGRQRRRIGAVHQVHAA